MLRGEFKHRYWFIADTPNIGRNFCVIWKDLWWRADHYRSLKYQGGCTIPLLQISVWCENYVAAWHYADTGIQLLFANNRNRVRGAVLGLLQDGACTDFFENLSVNSLKGDLSNDTTFKPSLFSLVNTFKTIKHKTLMEDYKLFFNFFGVMIKFTIPFWVCKVIFSTKPPGLDNFTWS